MTKLKKALIVRAVLLIAFIATGCTGSIMLDITGIWEGTLTWTSGPATGLSSRLSLDLTHEGNDLTGTATLVSHASQTFDIEITQGRARNRSLTVEASGTNTLVNPPAAVELSLTGDYNDTQMVGTGTLEVNGTSYEIDWELTLVWAPTPEE